MWTCEKSSKEKEKGVDIRTHAVIMGEQVIKKKQGRQEEVPKVKRSDTTWGKKTLR